jgi:MFS family permease
MSNKSLQALFIFNGVFIFSASLLGPLYAVYIESFNKGIFTISVTWASFFIASLLFTIVVSIFGDYIHEKEYLLVAGFLIRALAWFMFIGASNIVHFIALQALLGLGEALGTPAFDAIFAEHLDGGKHIKEYSIWKLIVNGTTAVGTLMGGFIAVRFGFSWLFFAMGSMALLAAFGIIIQERKLL